MKNIQIHSDSYKNAPEPDFPFTACSATDCTGLEPHPAFSESEIRSYESIYPYLPNRYGSNYSGKP